MSQIRRLGMSMSEMCVQCINYHTVYILACEVRCVFRLFSYGFVFVCVCLHAELISLLDLDPIEICLRLLFMYL